jgi:hypothetical protein
MLNICHRVLLSAVDIFNNMVARIFKPTIFNGVFKVPT